MGAATDALGIPAIAKQALMTGVTMAGQIAHGDKPENVLASGVIQSLPVDGNVKSAMQEASSLGLDIAHGKPVDKALLSRVDHVAQFLPLDPKLKNEVSQAVKLGHDTVGAISKGDIGRVLGTALDTGIADKLVIPNKMVESGIQLAKAMPVVTEARKLVAAQSLRGFDLASGLLGQHSHLFDVVHLRQALSPQDKLGFDMASSLRVGLVAHPPPKGLSPTAHAGHAMTMGMQGMKVAANKQIIMIAIKKSPSAAIGAAQAVKQIATVRENWLIRFLGIITMGTVIRIAFDRIRTRIERRRVAAFIRWLNQELDRLFS
jgi:hypothetical protein